MSKTPLQESKLRKWRSTVEAAGCRVARIEPLHEVRKGSGELLFGLYDTDVTDPEGHRLMPVAFVRGDAVVIVPEVIHSGSGESRLLMVEQRRIGNGQLSLEFPAGMLDEQVDLPLEVAVRELREETGVTVAQTDLVALHHGPLYSSPGAADEGIHFYGCRLELPAKEWDSLEGRAGGVPEENERIHVRLLRAEDALTRITSLQVRLALYLFRERFAE